MKIKRMAQLSLIVIKRNASNHLDVNPLEEPVEPSSPTDVTEDGEVIVSNRDCEMETLRVILESQKQKNECLQSCILKCSKQLSTTCKPQRMTFTFIHDDPKLLYYYTGLPDKDTYELVLSWCTTNKFCYYDDWNVEVLDKRDQLLLALMKLRLNLDYNDLAFRFQVSTTTVSNVFLTWLHVLHEILFATTVNKIPSTSKNRMAMPNSFSQFTNCRVVVDCTEVQCCVPRSSMNAQSQTYSHYKSRNTFKGLVGVAPNGVITYTSELYPGASSDKEIFSKCGITEQLCPGDLVLADKGFLIQDSVPAGVSVNIPPFLMHGQFTKEEVRVTRSIARARIHVERAIGRMKNFDILLYFPTHLRSFSTMIFQVCACLVNLQNPLINFEAQN